MHHATKYTRKAAVADLFYAKDAASLRHEVTSYLRETDGAGPYPKALIVPHAAYAYSGRVAASGYCLLSTVQHVMHRVVLLGPSHRDSFFGLATSSADEFETPLGTVPVDAKLVKLALKLPQVHVEDEAHATEHSLEVQLPFLQVTLNAFSLLPIITGHATPEEVCSLLQLVGEDAETLIVVSSDLSHYLDYPSARGLDSETAHLIERCQWHQLNGNRACGFTAIAGLLQWAQLHDLQVATLDMRNSGDTAGSRDRVVGYGSFVLY